MTIMDDDYDYCYECGCFGIVINIRFTESEGDT